MLPAVEEVVLHRVSLRGTAAAIAAARAPLKTALEQASWPATPAGEILFLRRVTASGNTREIATRAANQARRLADNAVDGWSPVAPKAMAVRFRSQASLLTCLLRDLLHGTARRHWYWRRWHGLLQQPADQAIVTLLQDDPLLLPTVVTQLQATHVWQPFWQTLGVTGGERLLTVAAQATGWSPAVQAARTLLYSGEVATEQPSVVQAAGQKIFDLTFLASASTLAANDSRPLLTALLTLWQQAPATLNQTIGAVQLVQLARRIGGQTTIPAAQQQPSPQKKENVLPQAGAHPGSAQHEPPAATSQPLPYPAPASTIIAERQNKRRTPPRNMAAPEPEGATQTERSPRIEITAQGTVTAVANQQASTTEKIIASEPYAHHFITGQGGLFYLLNFLNLSTVRAQLAADQPGAGWRWLHDLATALGYPPAGALLEFLASECGMKSGAELSLQPPLAPMNPLLRLGAGRYGDEAWQSGTWQTPARLIASASHVDLHFRLNDARLAVRRVGLDLSPGWLPWLGRVVTFHYGSGLEPEA